MTRTQPRRSRLSPAAAVACLLSLAVVALALWGLTRDPVPAAADFGPAAVTAPGDTDDGERDGIPRDQGSSRSRVLIEPPGTRPATLEAAQQETDRAAPVRLRVPALDLDVPLDAVGVAPDGQMEIPEDADRAGWYRYGPRPGDEVGSAVLAGHVDDANGPGAFLALTRAQEGDEVVIELDDGTELTYTVTARQTTDKKELPVDDLFDRDGAPRLQLITCTGEWSASTGRYTDNLVLTATPTAVGP